MLLQTSRLISSDEELAYIQAGVYIQYILYLGCDIHHNLSEVPVRKEIKDWQLILELSLFVTHCMSAPSL